MTFSFSKTLIAGLSALSLTAFAGSALASGVAAEHPKHGDFSFEGIFGTFDQAQLQRGYKVYKEVCASCHSMNLVSFRHLAIKGGPFYDEKYANPNDNPYVKSIAGEFEVDDVDTETGDAIKRKATPADHFPKPFANEYAAKASNNGAVPPDLSVMAKARHGGANYIYSILTGYKPTPEGLKVAAGQFYNPYMPGALATSWTGDHKNVPVGGLIAMPPPLTDDRVTYDDGTKATVDQEAKDVAAFIAWASDMHAVERKQMGVAVLAFLLLFALLTYASYKTVWRNEKH